MTDRDRQHRLRQVIQDRLRVDRIERLRQAEIDWEQDVGYSQSHLVGVAFSSSTNHNDALQFHTSRKSVMHATDNDMHCYKYAPVNLIDFYRETDF